MQAQKAAPVAGWLWLRAGDLTVRRSVVQFPPPSCLCATGQDTELQIDPRTCMLESAEQVNVVL